MNKRTFIQYIGESNFKELFIREMGWNNPKGQTTFDVTIEETTYEFQQIADRSGFQVLTCKVDDTPSSSMCKKIDTRLRRTANDYICIYHIPRSEHHLWVVPVKKVEKRDLVLVEYELASKADFLFEKMEDLCFDFDERTTIMDVKEKVQAGFIINSEKITKDFYTGFRKEHTNFAKYITGIDDEITDLKKNRNKQWYTSLMLNRLMFCYFIQKKGFLNLNPNYLRDKLAWVKSEKGEGHFYDSFYRGFLVSLFHDGLNSPRHQHDFVEKYGRIPYLNGGMFSIHELEEHYPALDIADEAFESLFAFFDQWHWHLDDRLTASGKDINPDVLGYIFEQYINDRAQMGAYYTKEDITEYIGRNTILPYLMDATTKKLKNSKTEKLIWQFLRESGDTYIYDAVKKGAGLEIPEEIAVGIDTTKPNLLERRSHWNERTPEAFALPTEIWRETIERLQRYDTIRQKIERGEITEINDFITYNLDIRQFVQDLLSQTDDHLLVKHFYTQLRKVTILDPTCGSGAFLFAALNILEPLYEVCIERMQAWNKDNPNLFKEELEEVNGKYRSNIRYFIYKNIILRNLYGVDIMVEATEIAKLRLFLKMVAVVDVNRRDPNLGLDPLPDIDFNIRCGNTLVGYATAEDLENDLQYGDMFANMEFKDKVHTEMDIVAHAYDTFKKVQLEQSADLETYRNAKQELKERLKKLDELLNRRLYASTVSGGSLKYDAWLKSHQPFHWLAEYYDIINGNGGFDVIIGNPPYVEYSKRNVQYEVKDYKTQKSSNLYAFVLERSCKICEHVALIVQMSSVGTESMRSLQEYIQGNVDTLHYGCYPERPKQLFDGACIALAILICNGRTNSKCNLYGAGVSRTTDKGRKTLFNSISYIHIPNDCFLKGYSLFPKFKRKMEVKIAQKFFVDSPINKYISLSVCPNSVSYRTAGGRYWKIVLNRPFATESTSNKTKFILNEMPSSALVALLNSNLLWWYYVNYFDLYNFKDYMIFNFCYNRDKELDLLTELGSELMMSYETNKIVNTQFIKSKQKESIFESFNPQLSKPIIDEIDKVLAKHYGFTEEELDFIINYDIKYRMGDELNENCESETPSKQEVKAKQLTPQQVTQQKLREQETKPKDNILTMVVRHETLERIRSGEKTTFKRYLDDEEFAKEVLVTKNGKIKLSRDYCPYTAKNIAAIKLVCDGKSLVKKVTKITFRSGINPQGKTAWKIIFHF